MGFNQKFINLIKTLYENIKVKAVINGTLGSDINMERGIKQGCPLSSYLYIMYQEPLMRKLQAELKGIRVGSTTYKTSEFIDDLTMYASEKEDVVALNDTIDPCKGSCKDVGESDSTVVSELSSGLGTARRRSSMLDLAVPKLDGKVLVIEYPGRPSRCPFRGRSPGRVAAQSPTPWLDTLRRYTGQKTYKISLRSFGSAPSAGLQTRA